MTLSNNHPAFPVVAHQNVYSTGMDLRDWFAGMALKDLNISVSDYGTMTRSPDAVAKYCYEIADAMLEERKNGK